MSTINRTPPSAGNAEQIILQQQLQTQQSTQQAQQVTAAATDLKLDGIPLTAKQKLSIDQLKADLAQKQSDIRSGQHTSGKRLTEDFKQLHKDGFSMEQLSKLAATVHNQVAAAQVVAHLKNKGGKLDDKQVQAFVHNEFHKWARAHGEAKNADTYKKFAIDLAADLQAQGLSAEDSQKVVSTGVPSAGQITAAQAQAAFRRV